MRTHLVRSKDVARGLFDSVFELLSQNIGPVQFKRADRPVSFTDSRPPLSWDAIFVACRGYRVHNAIPDDECLVLLTSLPNELNWFSSPDFGGSRSIFIHTGQWENFLIDGAPECAVAFQVWENVLQSLMFDSLDDTVRNAHDPAIGCVNDMCSWKPDVRFKLRTADVCRDCLERLLERGVSVELIKQALSAFESIRGSMLFSRAYRTTGIQEDLWPFPVAITRRKLTTSTEPLRRFLFLLDHFDSLLRTSVIFVGAAALGKQLSEFIDDHHLGSRPSLGDWVAAFQALASDASTRSLGLNSFQGDLVSRIQRVVGEADKGHVVQLRNEKRGHGYCDCQDSGYRDAFEVCQPSVTEIEKLLKPVLMRLTCYHVFETRNRDGRSFEVRARQMTGSHPDFVESVVDYEPSGLENIPCADRCYLYQSTISRWTGLYPYLLFQECPACRHPRVLIWDGEQYLDPYIGHRVKVTAC